MAILTCENCQIVFEGRPNRKYCSIRCRRSTERKKRLEAVLIAMTPEDRALYDFCRELGERLPTIEGAVEINFFEWGINP